MKVLNYEELPCIEYDFYVSATSEEREYFNTMLHDEFIDFVNSDNYKNNAEILAEVNNVYK